MGEATKQISEYIRKKGFNLSEISRKTGVPYMALYDSVANEKRDRDLRVDEFLALCKHLELDPIIFCPTASGTDTFGHPIYTETPVTVEDVLVAPASITEVLDMLNITGKKAVYNIAIPKGDTHDWQDCRVDFFGTSWRVIGFPQQGIEENIPGRWNQRWMVERYG